MDVHKYSVKAISQAGTIRVFLTAIWLFQFGWPYLAGIRVHKKALLGYLSTFKNTSKKLIWNPSSS